ncbi:2,3,4,5-tetrahydropyridine-2,6-dicarboxylate N-succinyltransferase [Ornithinimicrobium faecis]|uniref:2,3,4,5-tetrahydropyridine-2,6-dicarboxylate N-succinyltransferase n=1 Tax=Ornithinimicrobium faecis TaxID=2934158 RepID=A0ABY4YY94_9MICO|nr:2,3,4,5-tetrahydropyridine-2,6-dicarboxylate N-succinyltransferase [Ornithinimicrobium sp. HY1793]USQ81318.1 2,3,4,5-tetrahydropyridine-2,6-dicarboxylate N-succinyltransferase [Ornithinimicrobium sp. HY1793]
MTATAATAETVQTSRTELREFVSRPVPELREDPTAPQRISEFLGALESGEVRAAERDADGTWHANAWVKSGILAAFALSETLELPGWPGGAVDKSLVPPRQIESRHGIRLVPGGTSVRRGAGLAAGTVVMPPSYLNTGAWVGAGSMVDSHVLVGSCAQVGEHVHLSTAVQLGGVLEPVGATPVVIEDDVFVGAQCGLFEGVIVRERAVLAPGVTLTSRTVIYDLVNGREVRGEVPAGAVVVPGSRPARGAYAEGLGLSLYAPVIVKYRDGSTDASTVLEEALR